jgi:hypothetical protein
MAEVPRRRAIPHNLKKCRAKSICLCHNLSLPFILPYIDDHPVFFHVYFKINIQDVTMAIDGSTLKMAVLVW